MLNKFYINVKENVILYKCYFPLKIKRESLIFLYLKTMLFKILRVLWQTLKILFLNIGFWKLYRNVNELLVLRENILRTKAFKDQEKNFTLTLLEI